MQRYKNDFGMILDARYKFSYFMEDRKFSIFSAKGSDICVKSFKEQQFIDCNVSDLLTRNSHFIYLFI